MACDLCGLDRKTHRTVAGRGWDGVDVDVDVCFLCHTEGERGRCFDREAGAYVDLAASAPQPGGPDAFDDIPF